MAGQVQQVQAVVVGGGAGFGLLPTSAGSFHAGGGQRLRCRHAGRASEIACGGDCHGVGMRDGDARQA